jgi:urease accessory protein
VRSRIEIVAQYRSGPVPGAGRTVVTGIRAGYHFAGRQTGLGQLGVVHLVGTAAGPLGGDEAVIAVRLGPGARLAIRSAGATIVQPGLREPGSRLTMELQVAEGAHLDVACEPTVVIHRAEHEARTDIELTGDGQVRVLEQVLLGRSNEPGGAWTGRTVMVRDGAPELRHTLRSSLIAGPSGTEARAVSTLLISGGSGASGVSGTRGVRPSTAGQAVALPLASGGLLVTATGPDALSTRADLLAAAGRATADRPDGVTLGV